MPREEIVGKVCSVFGIKIEDLGVEIDEERFVDIGEGAIRCSVSKTGIVQIESRRPKWEVEFDDAVERARKKYPKGYFDALDLPALKARAKEKLGDRGKDLVQVFRIRVNPHQRKIFDVRQTPHADKSTEAGVNQVLEALWA